MSADLPVFYFARMVPNYRIPVLEQLNDRLGGGLVVCAGQPPGSSSLNYLMSDGERGYRQIYLRNRWMLGDKVHAQPFRKAFREAGIPGVVLAEESPRSVSLPFLLRYARRKGAGRVLWGHFSSLHRAFDPGGNRLDRYRLYWARTVEACACYTSGVAEMLRPWVADEKLFPVQNTIDLAPMLADRDRLSARGKSEIRRELSLSGSGPVLVFLGRLIREKGTDLLMEAVRVLAASRDATLLVIGDGPERAAMEAFGRRNALDVRFLGPLINEQAAPYLYASDMMVMPGYLGLVINHAFAFGLPVVSMLHPVGATAHSPEIEYIHSGKNGLLCEGSTAADLVAGIESVMANLPRYSEQALFSARNDLTIERMVDGLYQSILFAHRAVRA